MIRYRVRSGPSPIQGTGVFASVRIPRRAKIGEVTGDERPDILISYGTGGSKTLRNTCQ